jgi:multidrug resistance efflux pump
LSDCNAVIICIASVILQISWHYGSLVIAANIPTSSRPEKVFTRLVSRYFRHAELLIARLSGDWEQEMGWFRRAELAFYGNDLLEIPRKLALWGAQIDHQAFPDTSPERVQALDDSRRAFNVAEVQLEKVRQRLVEATAAKFETEATLARIEANLGAPGEQNARLREARSVKETANLNLEFTRVRAPVDGYVTNLDLQIGDQARANQAALALVDINSFWVHGFFQETLIEKIRSGDRAVVTLMSYPNAPLEGRVDSFGRGIAQTDGSTGFQLLPNISPTFEWIRLAQRVPVRIRLADVPEDIELIVGTTASVLVMTGTAGGQDTKPVPAAPGLLQ